MTHEQIFCKREYQARGHYHVLLWIKDPPVIGVDPPEKVLSWIQERMTCHIPDENASLQRLLQKKSQGESWGDVQIRFSTSPYQPVDLHLSEVVPGSGYVTKAMKCGKVWATTSPCSSPCSVGTKCLCQKECARTPKKAGLFDLGTASSTSLYARPATHDGVIPIRLNDPIGPGLVADFHGGTSVIRTVSIHTIH